MCDCQFHIILQTCCGTDDVGKYQSVCPVEYLSSASPELWHSLSEFIVFPDPFKPFIIFSNRHEIRRIDLHKGEFSVLVPGLRNTIALDFHLNESSLYWTDVVEDKIYRGKLSENGGKLYVQHIYMYSGILKL